MCKFKECFLTKQIIHLRKGKKRKLLFVCVTWCCLLLCVTYITINFVINLPWYHLTIILNKPQYYKCFTSCQCKMLVYFSLTSVLIIRTKHIITVDHNSSKTIHYYFTKTLQVTYTVCSTTWNNASTFSSKNLCSICCNVSLWCLSVATMLSFICKKIGHNFNIFKEQIFLIKNYINVGDE